MAARRLGEEGLDRPVAIGLGDAQLGVVAQAHQAEILGQRHPLRAGVGGLRDEAAGGGEVAGDVGRGDGLDGGELRHGASLR